MSNLRIAGGPWRHILILIGLFGLLFTAAPAAAVDLTDGIRFGAFSIHPSLLTSVKYIDNVYFLPNDYELYFLRKQRLFLFGGRDSQR